MEQFNCTSAYTSNSSIIQCDVDWDGYYCWPVTPANTTVYAPCPKERFKQLPMVDDKLAFRVCNATGQWSNNSWTNYFQCVEQLILILTLESKGNFTGNGSLEHKGTSNFSNPEDQKLTEILRDIYFFGSIISCLLLLLTLFIFSYFKSLQCARISIHKHLVVSFIVRSVIIIFKLEPFVTNTRSWTYLDIDWLCRTMMALEQYSIMANIAWMFIEGLFLHRRVAVSIFNSNAPFKVYYMIGWGMPGIIICIWCLCTYFYNKNNCWKGSFEQPFIWIIVIPILVCLSLNLIFLVNIIRIIVTKLKANNTVEADQVRKAAKATLVLLPLLGLTNILFFVEPPGADMGQKMAYRMTNALLQSSQERAKLFSRM